MGKNNKLRKYIMNVLIVHDQVINVVFCLGDPDETISSRLGKLEAKHGGKIPWRYPLRAFIAWTLNKWDTDHCENSIEEDEGKRNI